MRAGLEMSRLLELMRSSVTPPLLAIDVETTGLDRTSEIVTLAIGWQEQDGSVTSESFYLDRFSKLPNETATNEVIVRQLLDWSLFRASFPGLILFHNLNFDIPFLMERFRPDVNRLTAAQFCRLASI